GAAVQDVVACAGGESIVAGAAGEVDGLDIDERGTVAEQGGVRSQAGLVEGQIGGGGGAVDRGNVVAGPAIDVIDDDWGLAGEVDGLDIHDRCAVADQRGDGGRAGLVEGQIGGGGGSVDRGNVVAGPAIDFIDDDWGLSDDDKAGGAGDVVVAGSAAQNVVTAPARQVVVPSAAIRLVVAIAAVEIIVVVTAVECASAGPAVEAVGATAAV